MSNTVTSSYVDLATFDDLEKYLYNGPEAITLFVRCVQKSSWFSQVPIPLTQLSGSPDFGGDISFKVSKSGDYLTYCWLRCTLPAISFTAGAGLAVRWQKNIGHNLIDLAYISFNDLKVQEFDNYWLDMWAAHTVSAIKRDGYNNMIGNVSALTTASLVGLPAYTLNVPLPFFFTRDTGVALPTAAITFNDITIHLEFKTLDELLIRQGGLALSAINSGVSPKLGGVQLWANYAVVTNEERALMGKCPRDMVIEQVQKSGSRSLPVASIGLSPQHYDIRMSHAIKALFWNIHNKSVPSAVTTSTFELSNYGANVLGGTITDVISASSLLYEGTYRLFDMGSDYFSLVQQFYHWDVIPDAQVGIGYHSYSYAVHPESLDPSASTNYGKLTNVTLAVVPSQTAVDNVTAQPSQYRYDFILRALNFNVITIKGGGVGLPVL